MSLHAESTLTADRAEELVTRVQALQFALEELEPSAAGELADELVAALLQMYGSGLERIMAALCATGAEGEQVAVSLTSDPLVSTLLLIHDLHPVPLAQRVQAALDSVRPYMASHGGNVELLGLERGVARIHLKGSCSDCSASAVTLELAIKQALEEAAPDLEGLEVQGMAPQTMGGAGVAMVTGSSPSGMELPIVMSGPAIPAHPPAPAPASGAASWFEVPAGGHPPAGTLVSATVAQTPLLIANVEGTLLAYRDLCAGCGAQLHDGELDAGTLRCRGCERAFFLPRAGRSLDSERLQLEPIPLLVEAGRVKVALSR